MIKGKFSEINKYTYLSEDIKTGLKWLCENNLKEIPIGKYYIDGERIFVNIQEYNTKIGAKYEAHREYVDVQCVICGAELVGVTDRENCNPAIPYDEEKDIEFMDIIANDTYQSIEEGEFLILYPNDAHKPSMAIDNKPSFVKKAVVKVKLN